VLGTGALLLLGAVLFAGVVPPTSSPDAISSPSPTVLVTDGPPGYQPGMVYLGFSSPEESYEDEADRVGEPTVRRGRYLGIEEIDAELATMRDSLQAGRLPWTSFSTDWDAVTAGRWDAVLRQRFAGYRSLPGPALATFSHEPVGKGEPAAFTAAWRHILDLADEVGTGQVSLVPIMNGYIWGDWAGWTDDEIAAYLPPDLLARWPLVGVDVYHGATRDSPGQPPSTRLADIVTWADRQGVGLLAIGEIGVHDAEAWTDTWAFVKDNAERFMAVSYFNSTRNVRLGADWYLQGETLEAFQDSLASPTVARLDDSGREPAGRSTRP
jgi:hypothetical protein